MSIKFLYIEPYKNEGCQDLNLDKTAQKVLAIEWGLNEVLTGLDARRVQHLQNLQALSLIILYMTQLFHITHLLHITHFLQQQLR